MGLVVGEQGKAGDFLAGNGLLASTSLPSALPWWVGWALRIAKMTFANKYGGYKKTPGLAARNFDLICCMILVASHLPSMGLSFPICEMPRLGWALMTNSPILIFNDSSHM